MTEDTRIIKRYGNRKLYDTATSRYVTLEEVARMIETGETVKITDNETNKDITALTLAQIVLDAEKKKYNLPLEIVKRLLGERSGEAIGEMIQKMPEQVQTLRVEAEKRFGEMKKKSDSEVKQFSKRFKELISESQQQLEDFEKKLERKLDSTVSEIASSPVLSKQILAMEEKLEELEKRMEKLSKKNKPRSSNNKKQD